MEQYRTAGVDAIEAWEPARSPIWIESIAVAGKGFIREVSGNLNCRLRVAQEEVTAGVWTVREAPIPYARFSGGKNGR